MSSLYQFSVPCTLRFEIVAKSEEDARAMSEVCLQHVGYGGLAVCIHEQFLLSKLYSEDSRLENKYVLEGSQEIPEDPDF